MRSCDPRAGFGPSIRTGRAAAPNRTWSRCGRGDDAARDAHPPTGRPGERPHPPGLVGTPVDHVEGQVAEHRHAGDEFAAPVITQSVLLISVVAHRRTLPAKCPGPGRSAAAVGHHDSHARRLPGALGGPRSPLPAVGRPRQFDVGFAVHPAAGAVGSTGRPRATRQVLDVRPHLAAELLLTTTDASRACSARRRLGLSRDDDRLLVLGSNFGQRHPRWSSNLIAEPEAAVARRHRDTGDSRC